MQTNNIAQLNKDFAFDNGNHQLSIKIGKGDIPVVEVQNEHARATISLQGAQVLSWVPTGEEEVIWISDEAIVSPGKSVRGGVPICWPWFGPHESSATYPAHGFARIVLWQLTNSRPLSANETQITFQLDSRQLDASMQPMWPLATVLEYRITIGRTLTLELTTYNHSEQTITIGQALHTYFRVDDVTKTSVYGLEGKDYLDKTDGFKHKTQVGPLRINAEVDRVYLQTTDEVIIDDQKRKIIIKKQGSRSTVVWNPWQVVAEKMGDLGQDGYRKMLCVESANVADDTLQINAAESYSLRVTYGVEK